MLVGMDKTLAVSLMLLLSLEVTDRETIFSAVVYMSQVYKDIPGPWGPSTQHIVEPFLSYDCVFYLPNLVSLHSLPSQPVYHLYQSVSIPTSVSVSMPNLQLPTRYVHPESPLQVQSKIGHGK